MLIKMENVVVYDIGVVQYPRTMTCQGY